MSTNPSNKGNGNPNGNPNKTKPNGQSNAGSIDDLMHDLEDLRSNLVDLEAIANAAKEALEHLPYVPRYQPDYIYSPEYVHSLLHPSADPEQVIADAELAGTNPLRLQMGRLQTLVYSTSQAALGLLSQTNELLELANRLTGGVDKHGTRSANLTSTLTNALEEVERSQRKKRLRAAS